MTYFSQEPEPIYAHMSVLPVPCLCPNEISRVVSSDDTGAFSALRMGP